jgi:hypothetical protein
MGHFLDPLYSGDCTWTALEDSKTRRDFLVVRSLQETLEHRAGTSGMPSPSTSATSEPATEVSAKGRDDLGSQQFWHTCRRRRFETLGIISRQAPPNSDRIVWMR